MLGHEHNWDYSRVVHNIEALARGPLQIMTTFAMRRLDVRMQI